MAARTKAKPAKAKPAAVTEEREVEIVADGLADTINRLQQIETELQQLRLDRERIDQHGDELVSVRHAFGVSAQHLERVTKAQTQIASVLRQAGGGFS